MANIAAGGTGLSLHDINGNRPRVSLICPTFNAKEYVQTLGRIFRNGAKSDSLQKVLVAADSVEETVMTSINSKLKNLEKHYMSNTPDHSERDHAPFSPSSLKYVAACAGYEGRSGTSAAAEKGTRIHEEALEVRDPSALHDEEEIEIYDKIVLEEAQFNNTIFGSRESFEEMNEIQVHVDLGDTSTWGTCDRFLVSKTKAVMADYKTGISPIDTPKENWQAKAYTLGAFQAFPEIDEIIFVFYIPVRGEVLYDTFTRDDVPTLTEELSSVILKGKRYAPNGRRNP